MSVINNNNKLEAELITELWENAAFNTDVYKTLEKTITKLAKTEDSSTIPSRENYYELATIRNRHLITHAEQDKLRDTIIGFFGMSVGSNVVLSWMLQSRANIVKIMDPDTISPTNLNRIRFGWNDVGKLKVDVVKRELMTLNPYAKVISSTNTTQEYIKKFLSSPAVSIIVDEIDDMESKIFLRKCAKELRIPLVSAADVGDNVVLDIERYDINPQPKMFLGRIPDIETLNFADLSDIERKKIIIKLIGFEHMSEKLLDSLLSIGKSIVSWPQLGATASMAGGIVSTTIKKIILGEQVKSGRYIISLDEILVRDYARSTRVTDRKQKVEKVKSRLKIT